MNILVTFNWLALTIIVTHRAASGQQFTFPVTLGRPRLGRASRRTPSVW